MKDLLQSLSGGGEGSREPLLTDALAFALLDMIRVMPPNGRTREQMDAMVSAGKAISVWRDL